MVQDGDPTIAQRLAQQMVSDVGQLLGRCLPPDIEPGGAERAGRLRSAGEDPRTNEGVDQVGLEAPAGGGREPTSHADGGVGDEEVGRPRDDGIGGSSHAVLGAEREGADARRVHDGQPVASQQLCLFGPSAVGGDADGEALERLSHRLDDMDASLRVRCRPVTAG